MITFVQQCTGTANIGALLGTAKGTFPSNVTAGNVIVVAIGNADEIDTVINSVTDSLSNTYNSIGSAGASLNNLGLNLYYAGSIGGGSSIVSVSGSSPFADQIGFIASEYSGVSGAPFDLSAFVDNQNSGVGGLGTTGTTTTTNSGTELLFSAFAVVTTSGTGTAGGGNTMRGTLRYASNTLFTEDQTVTSTGAYAGTMSFATSKTYVGGIATFKASAGAVTHTTVPYLGLMGVGQ